MEHEKTEGFETRAQDAGRCKTRVRPGAGVAAASSRSTDEFIADSSGRAALNLALLGLLSTFLIPAVAPFLGAAAIRRGHRLLDDPDQGVRASVALAMGVMAALCGVTFWLLWGLMRPTPGGLLVGWPALRRLPAVSFGFQRSPGDPFGFTPQAWHMPGH